MRPIEELARAPYYTVLAWVDQASADELLEVFERAMDQRIGTLADCVGRRLAVLGDRRAVDLAIRLLTPPAPRWANQAALLLGRLGDARAVPALIASLTNAGLRDAAITALGRLRTQESEDALVATAERVRSSTMVEALCAANTPPALEAVLRATRESGTLLGESAAWAVARVADERFVPYLLELVAGPLRWAGLTGLQRAAHGRAVPALVFVLKQPADGHTHRLARSALASCGRSASPALYVESGGDHRLRRSMAWLCGRIPDVRADSLLEILLGDEDAYVRGQAVDSLGRMANANAAPALLRALEDPSHRVRAHAATALGRLGVRSARPALERHAASDGVACVRDAAAAALRTLSQ
ncbi:HEAT repeat domain-containing protein [Nonomuraea sp. LPB2021202275-12-8]|uniref:HEAT repeat domain-containing protein n=1 Tax=Nonomuraea sp. LPB2021202275-12-8 TaxID=3120159 RepID=UPI00300D2A4C